VLLTGRADRLGGGLGCGALPGGQMQALRQDGAWQPGVPGAAKMFPGGEAAGFGERSVVVHGRAQREPGCGNRRRGASWPGREGMTRRPDRCRRTAAGARGL